MSEVKVEVELNKTERRKADVPEPRLRQRAPYSIWLVWLIPAIAVVIGLWLGVKSIVDKGPVITITFKTAEGLEAGKTKIKYKDVDIGIVKSIKLAADRQHVEIKAELSKFDNVNAMLVADTRFWVVRPQISAGGVSGLGTLLSGAYIGVDIGHSAESERSFSGLEVPPIVTADVPGRRFILKSPNLGSLSVGTAVYFRRLQVGQVVAYDLGASGKELTFTIFVNAPYDKFVTQHSRFWHASGVDVSLNADGIKVNAESLMTLVSGGVAFQDPENSNIPATPAPENSEFPLHADRALALKAPDRFGHDYLLLFQNSVRGLSVGAPVDFRGLSIGEVTAISVEALPSAKNPNPQMAVKIRVYPGRIPTLAGAGNEDGSEATQRAVLNPMVAKGFRAQLRSGNLLTGQLYVALDFFPRTAAAKMDWMRKPALFPTEPASLDSLQNSVASIVDKLDKLPLDAVVKDVQQILKDVQQTLGSVSQTMQHIDGVVQQVGQDIAPEARKAIEDARKTLGTLSQTLSTVEQTASPDGSLSTQASSTLQELAKTAKSLRALTDYLERHPESLLRGKPEDKP